MFTPKLNVLFWIRKQKQNRAGKCPLYCRVTVGGVRLLQFSTGVLVAPDEWNPKKQRCEDPISQGMLIELNRRISKAQLHAISNGINLSADLLKDFINDTFKAEKRLTLEDVFYEFLKIKEEETKTDLSLTSYKSYCNRFKNISDYVRAHPEISTIHSWTESHNKGLQMYLRGQFGNNYVMKHLQLLKTVFRYAKAQGYITRNPAEFLRLSFTRVKKQRLSLQEIAKIQTHRFASDRLQQVADVFIFQCFTGLSYIDISTLTAEDINDKWIFKNRGKTDIQSFIPLFPESKKIWNKYRANLPVISNQRYNSYLKEIAEIVGINKRLTTHLGRKTFGHMMADRGFSVDSIAKMLGHANSRVTQTTYTAISTSRIELEMKMTEKIAKSNKPDLNSAA